MARCLQRILYGLGFLGAGSVCLYLSLAELERAYHSKSWPQVEGVIVSSETSDEYIDPGLWTLEIDYEYVVDDFKYKANFRESWCCWGWTLRDRMARAFPQGGRVPIYYDPQDPRESVLERGMGWERFPFLHTSSALMFSALGVGFLLFGKKRDGTYGLGY